VDSVSGTAIFAAQVRAAHALLHEDPIFFDPFALALAGVSEGEVRDLFTAIPDVAARVARVLPNQRARFFDEELEKAVHGVSTKWFWWARAWTLLPGGART
jgi:O-methyltransferase involved in polyketide biosynthesis